MRDRFVLDRKENILFINFAGVRIESREQVDEFASLVREAYESQGKRVYAVVNYEGTEIAPEIIDYYGERIKDLYDRYGLSTVRYSSSGHYHISLMMGTGTGISKICELLTGKIARLLDAEMCVILLYDEREESINAQLPAYGVSDEHIRLLRSRIEEKSIATEVFKTSEPYMTNDAANDPVISAAAANLGVKTMLAVPLQVGERTLGTLEVMNKAGGFIEEDKRLVTIFASQAAHLLANAQLFEQVRESEERYRQIFESTLDGLYRGTPEGRLVTVNPALASMLGYGDPKELTGANLFEDLFVERAAAVRLIKELGERGQALDVECDLRRVSGERTPARVSIRVITDKADNGFFQNQSTAQSTYHSLQASLTKRFSRGLQFLVSYTWAKSIDNASGQGGGAGFGGVVNPGGVGETSTVIGNQLDNRANRGVSDFDRTHRLVASYLWDLPKPAFADGSTAARMLLANWQVAGIVTAMSGLPIDIVDTGAASFYGLSGGSAPLARPDWTAGANRDSATSNVPAGFFFNPFAFQRPVIQAGQVIPSSNGSAVAGAIGTDFGNVGRNVLRGPRQTNVDFSIIKRFPVLETRSFEFRAEFFNLFNQVNLANPISDFNAILASGGSIDPLTGKVINPGAFGRIISTSNNPRIIQLAFKFNF